MRKPIAISVISFFLALVYILMEDWIQKKYGWSSKPLSLIAYIVATLDVFLWYLRPYLLDVINTRLSNHHNDSNGAHTELRKDVGIVLSQISELLGLSGIGADSNPLVQKCTKAQLKDLREGLESLKHGSGYQIMNPFLARDVAFEIIKRINKKDRIIAVMNVTERPFLLEDTYVSYFLKDVHAPALAGKKTEVDFTRIIVSTPPQRNAIGYTQLVDGLKKLGVAVLECTPDQFVAQGFSGDVLIRIRGESEMDMVCLVGDKDPHSPADEYRAVLAFGDKVSPYLKKCDAIIKQLR